MKSHFLKVAHACPGSSLSVPFVFGCEADQREEVTQSSLNLFWDLRDTEMLQISIFIANYFNRYNNFSSRFSVFIEVDSKAQSHF